MIMRACAVPCPMIPTLVIVSVRPKAKVYHYGRGVLLPEMRPVLLLIAAYLLGSIPFGYLIVRAMAGADVRESGSGGTGATNGSRRAGKLAGVITLLLDAAKGALAVLLTRWLATD